MNEELNSAKDDRGLSSVKFVMHGNSSVKDAAEILEHGLRVEEGRATVSSDICHAAAWATSSEKRANSKSLTQREKTESGLIFVIRIPPNLHLGYGIFTSASVDPDKLTITGAPIKYASGRKQLALYNEPDTESKRRELERRHKLGDKPEQIIIEPETIISTITPTEPLLNYLQQLQDRIKVLDPINIKEEAVRISVLITSDDGNIVPDTLKELVRTTVESVTISRLRNLWLDAMRLNAYRVIQGGEPQPKEINPAKLKEKVGQLTQQTSSEALRLDPEWLTGYTQEKCAELTRLVTIS